MLLKKQVDEAKATYKKYVADYEQQKQNVYLEVWVRVRKGWNDDARALKTLGYE